MAYINFSDIDDRSFEKLFENGFKVSERLDTIYFRVRVSNDGTYALKTPRYTRVSDYDIAMNSVYRAISVFAEEHVRPMSSWLLDVVGPCTIGFFYLPVPKTRLIDYTGFDKKFIINDLHVDDPAMKDVITVEDIRSRDDLFARPPLIASFEQGCPDDVRAAMETLRNVVPASDLMKCIGVICNGRSYTGIPLDRIEGIIITSGKYNYNISVTDTSTLTDQYLKAFYRDRVLLNVAHTISDEGVLKPEFESILTDSRKPLHRICDLFVEYMAHTDLLKKDVIDEDDVTPPCDGYMGDMDLTDVTPMARIIARGNPVYMNILRMFINEFRPDVPHANLEKRDYSENDKSCFRNVVALLSR